ncbi:AAA family ATPase [Candidatus Micrarchaeota archaeon]|nr:AAA family ATPase [Candidatus Micrarchaeota archaeon]
MNLFKNTSVQNNIIRNEEVFYPDYLPEEMLHREKELREIVFNLKGVENKNRPPSIVIHGPPGTGKTSVIRYIIKELKEYTRRVAPVLVNCWNTPNRYGILNKITNGMDAFVPQTGVAIEDMFNRIKKVSQEEGKIPLVVLDEADVIVKNKEENQAIFYDILRLRETHGVTAGLVVITNDVSFLLRIDRRIKSSLAQSVIEFKPYGPQELKSILKERAKIGLFQGTYDDEIVGVCAAFGAKNNGDARIAINLMWLAAKEAEKNNQSKIELENLENLKKNVKIITQENLENIKLTEEERRVVDAIGEEEISSSDLYKKLDMSERTVRHYLLKLEELGVIEVRMESFESGRVKMIRRKR